MNIPSIVIAVLMLVTAVPCEARGGDQTERNKAVTRRIFDDVLSQGRFDVSDQLYTADFVGHAGAKTFTHAESLEASRGWRTAFPDLSVTIDLEIAERDLVVIRWTARGTNTGAANGIPVTGKRVEVCGTAIFRLVDGKIAEEWTSSDTLGLLRQLGLLNK